MAQVSKPYNFANQTTADATQVDADFDTIYTLVNGNLDDSNMAIGALSQAIATEGVSPSQTKGIAYSSDVFGSSFIFNGLTATKDASITNQVNVASGIVMMIQADGNLRRLVESATKFQTSLLNSTYYLDVNPDGTWSWNNAHSVTSGYLSVATVTSDANGNVATITQSKDSYKVTLLQNAVGPVMLEAEPPNVMAWIR